MAISIDAQAAINEIAKDLERAERSRDDVTPVGFYGEDETYGTQSDWLTGEGLTSAWGTDPGWGLRSTYSNPVAEYLGEDPVTNLLVDAKGMLQRGGKPSGWDYANLALSTVPVAGQAAVKAVTPLAIATKKAIQDWGKRKHKYVDFDVDQHITATTDPTFKATGFRETLQGKILEKLGMLPEYKDLVKMQKNADPMIQAWYDDYVLKGKSIEETLEKTVDDWLDFDKIIAKNPQIKSWDLEVEDTLSKIMGKETRKSSMLPKTTELPKDIPQLPGTKPIQDMTWREWDDLSDSPFTLSSKQNAMMRAQGITNPDDVLDHFWGKGARKDFVGWLEEAISKTNQDFPEELEFVRFRDLKSGYIDEMTDKQFKNDIAWSEIEIEAQKIAGTDPMVVAEKMAFKPDKVTHAEWARLTEELSREETINLARRMTLRLID